MSIKNAVQLSLTAPRPSLGTTVNAPAAGIAVTLEDLLQGVIEIERHAKSVDPRNTAMLRTIAALREQAQAAVTEAQAASRLKAAMTGRPASTGRPGGGSPF
jgi:hypothetical protein